MPKVFNVPPGQQGTTGSGVLNDIATIMYIKRLQQLQDKERQVATDESKARQVNEAVTQQKAIFGGEDIPPGYAPRPEHMFSDFGKVAPEGEAPYTDTAFSMGPDSKVIEHPGRFGARDLKKELVEGSKALTADKQRAIALMAPKVSTPEGEITNTPTAALSGVTSIFPSATPAAKIPERLEATTKALSDQSALVESEVGRSSRDRILASNVRIGEAGARTEEATATKVEADVARLPYLRDIDELDKQNKVDRNKLNEITLRTAEPEAKTRLSREQAQLEVAGLQIKDMKLKAQQEIDFRAAWGAAKTPQEKMAVIDKYGGSSVAIRSLADMNARENLRRQYVDSLSKHTMNLHKILNAKETPEEQRIAEAHALVNVMNDLSEGISEAKGSDTIERYSLYSTAPGEIPAYGSKPIPREILGRMLQGQIGSKADPNNASDLRWAAFAEAGGVKGNEFIRALEQIGRKYGFSDEAIKIAKADFIDTQNKMTRGKLNTPIIGPRRLQDLPR